MESDLLHEDGMLSSDIMPENGEMNIESDDGCTNSGVTVDKLALSVDADLLAKGDHVAKHSRNSKEKERKGRIKHDLQEICNLLPKSQSSDRKQTHHEMLQQTLEFMRKLIYQNKMLGGSVCEMQSEGDELSRLQKENEELQHENARYQRIFDAAGLPMDVDPSELVITWHRRAPADVFNSSLLTDDLLPASHDCTQQVNSSSDYTTFTELLNETELPQQTLELTKVTEQPSSVVHPPAMVFPNGQQMPFNDQNGQYATTPVDSSNNSSLSSDQTAVSSVSQNINSSAQMVSSSELNLCVSESSRQQVEDDTVLSHTEEETASPDGDGLQDFHGHDLPVQQASALTDHQTVDEQEQLINTANDVTSSQPLQFVQSQSELSTHFVTQHQYQQHQNIQPQPHAINMLPMNADDTQPTFFLHNGQLLLVNQQQQLHLPSNTVNGPGFSVGHPPIFVNHFSTPPSVTTPQAIAQPLPHVGQNQTVMVNTPHGPLSLNTVPSQPNQHPSALILPNGQIVPVVTQPNLLFPPQQCTPVTGGLLIPTPPCQPLMNIMQPGSVANRLSSLTTNSLPTPVVSVTAGSTSLMRGVFQVPVSMPHQFAVPQQIVAPGPLIQALPAQGHLPVHNSFSSVVTPCGPTASTSVPNLPPTVMATVTPEGTIILTVPNSEPALPKCTSKSKKTTAPRPLMPKPAAPSVKTDILPSCPASTSSVGIIPSRLPTLPPSRVVSAGSYIVGSGQNMAIGGSGLGLTSSAVPMSVCTTTTATDILAKATESIFMVSSSLADHLSPSSICLGNASTPVQIKVADTHQLSVDTDRAPAVSRPWSKKKSKTMEPSVPVCDKQVDNTISSSSNIFDQLSGTEGDDEQSDINDFSDLIRLEPLTPMTWPHSRESAVAPKVKKLEVKAYSDGAESVAVTYTATVSTEAVALSTSTVVSTDTDSLAVASCISTESVTGEASLCISDELAAVATEAQPLPLTIESTACCTLSIEPVSRHVTMPSLSPNVVMSEQSNGENTALVQVSSLPVSSSKTLFERLEEALISSSLQVSSAEKPYPGKAEDTSQESGKLLVTEQVDKSGEKMDKALLTDELNSSAAPVASSLLMADSDSVCCSVASNVSTKSNWPIVSNVSGMNVSLSRSHRKAKKMKKDEPDMRMLKVNSSPEVSPLKTITSSCQNIIENKPSDPQLSVDLEDTSQQSMLQDTKHKGFALSNFLPESTNVSHAKPVIYQESHSDSVQPIKSFSEEKSADGDRSLNSERLAKSPHVTEEATQTTRKELKRDKTRKHSQTLPDTLTFSASDLMSMVDVVENMAVETQTEKLKKSHSRKHRSSSVIDAGASKKKKKNKDSSSKVICMTSSEVQKVPLLKHETCRTAMAPINDPIDVFIFTSEDNGSHDLDSSLLSYRNKKLTDDDLPADNSTVSAKPSEPSKPMSKMSDHIDGHRVSDEVTTKSIFSANKENYTVGLTAVHQEADVDKLKMASTDRESVSSPCDEHEPIKSSISARHSNIATLARHVAPQKMSNSMVRSATKSSVQVSHGRADSDSVDASVDVSNVVISSASSSLDANKHSLSTDAVSNKHSLSTEGISNKQSVSTDVLNKQPLSIDTVSNKQSVSTDAISNKQSKQSVSIDGISNKQFVSIDDVSNKQSMSTDGVSNKHSMSTDAVSNKQSVSIDGVSNKQSMSTDAVSNKQSVSIDGASNKQSMSTDAVSNKQSVSTDAVSNKQSVSTDAVSNKQSVSINGASNKQSMSADAVSAGSHVTPASCYNSPIICRSTYELVNAAKSLKDTLVSGTENLCADGSLNTCAMCFACTPTTDSLTRTACHLSKEPLISATSATVITTVTSHTSDRARMKETLSVMSNSINAKTTSSEIHSKDSQSYSAETSSHSVDLSNCSVEKTSCRTNGSSLIGMHNDRALNSTTANNFFLRHQCSQKASDCQISRCSQMPGLYMNSSLNCSSGTKHRSSCQEEHRQHDEFFIAPVSSSSSCAVDPFNYSYTAMNGASQHHDMVLASSVAAEYSLSRNPFCSFPSPFGFDAQSSSALHCPSSRFSPLSHGLPSCGLEKQATKSASSNGMRSVSATTDLSKSRHQQQGMARDSYMPGFGQCSSVSGNDAFIDPKDGLSSRSSGHHLGPSTAATRRARSPSITSDHPSPYFASVAGTLTSPPLHHPPSTLSDHQCASHSSAFELSSYQSLAAGGSHFSPNLTSVSFDPPPLNYSAARDCASVGHTKKADKDSKQLQHKLPATQPRSTLNRSSSKPPKKSSKAAAISNIPSSMYDLDPAAVFDGRCMTPYFGLTGGVSPNRSGLQGTHPSPADSLSYFQANLFGGAGRQLSSAAKTLHHHRDSNPFSPFSTTGRSGTNGLGGLNFQTGPHGFGMDAHMAAAPIMPHSASAHGFGFGSLFPDVASSLAEQQRDALHSISPIKFGHPGAMQESLHHQQTPYPGRAQHMLHDFNALLGGHHQHSGAFDARAAAIGSAMGPPFAGPHAASFSVGALNFPMHNL